MTILLNMSIKKKHPVYTCILQLKSRNVWSSQCLQFCIAIFHLLSLSEPRRVQIPESGANVRPSALGASSDLTQVCTACWLSLFDLWLGLQDMSGTSRLYNIQDDLPLFLFCILLQFCLYFWVLCKLSFIYGMCCSLPDKFSSNSVK